MTREGNSVSKDEFAPAAASASKKSILRPWKVGLSRGCTLAVMHWNYDPQTPRGPSMGIRPRPEDCQRAVKEAGFLKVGSVIHLPPWHYGFTASCKKEERILNALEVLKLPRSGLFR